MYKFIRIKGKCTGFKVFEIVDSKELRISLCDFWKKSETFSYISIIISNQLHPKGKLRLSSKPGFTLLWTYDHWLKSYKRKVEEYVLASERVIWSRKLKHYVWFCLGDTPTNMAREERSATRRQREGMLSRKIIHQI